MTDAGHGAASGAQPDLADRPEAVPDDARVLRHVLQPREVPRPRAEGPLCVQGGGRGARGEIYSLAQKKKKLFYFFTKKKVCF